MMNTATPTPTVHTVYVAPAGPDTIEAEMDLDGDTIRMQFDSGVTRRTAARMLLAGVLGLDADELPEDELSARPLDGNTTRYTAFI